MGRAMTVGPPLKGRAPTRPTRKKREQEKKRQREREEKEREKIFQESAEARGLFASWVTRVGGSRSFRVPSSVLSGPLRSSHPLVPSSPGRALEARSLSPGGRRRGGGGGGDEERQEKKKSKKSAG